MQTRERGIVTAVFSVLMLSWLGFLVHRSPRFPGSGIGTTFGMAGATLMFVTLVYLVVKRLPSLHARVTRHLSMQTLLAMHVYAGIVGALLALVHTGHKFESWMGVALTGLMLLAVGSGFAVRYLLPFVNREIKDKLLLLQTARGDLDSAWGMLEKSPRVTSSIPNRALLVAGFASFGIELPFTGHAAEVARLADSVADLEYAIRTHELLKRWFSRLLTLHVMFSVVLYALLAVHIASEIYFGLRSLR